MFYARLALSALALSALVGCEDAEVCTQEAVASVQVTVEDNHGEVVPEVEVFYAVEGGSEVDCESADERTFVCGYEVSGEITVSTAVEGNYALASETVTVPLTEDGCHVVTQSITLVLELVEN